MKRFLIQGSAFVLSTLMLVACGDKTEPPKHPVKPPKLTMDACSRLPVADVERVLGVTSLQAETHLTNNPHLYAGGCHYKMADGKLLAQLLIPLDEHGSEFDFIPGRFGPTRGSKPGKHVSGYASIEVPNGALVWTSNEKVFFELSVMQEDGSMRKDDARLDMLYPLAAVVSPTPNPDAVSEPTSESTPEHADQTPEPASH